MNYFYRNWLHIILDVTEAIESTTEGIDMAEFIYEIVIVTGLNDSDEDDEDDEEDEDDVYEDDEDDEDEDDDEDNNIIYDKDIEKKDNIDEDIDEDIPSIPIPSESESSESLNSVGTKKPPVTRIVKRPNITPAQIRKSISGDHLNLMVLTPGQILGHIKVYGVFEIGATVKFVLK